MRVSSVTAGSRLAWRIAVIAPWMSMPVPRPEKLARPVVGLRLGVNESHLDRPVVVVATAIGIVAFVLGDARGRIHRLGTGMADGGGLPLEGNRIRYPHGRSP